MSKYKNKELFFNRSVHLEATRFNKIINIKENKKDIIINQKFFLENLLDIIKEVQCDYLTKRLLLNNKNEKVLIREILLKFSNNLKIIKKEKENEMKLLKIKRVQKKSDLKDIMINTIIHKRSSINNEIMNANVLINDESNDYINELLKNDENDFKTKNFIIQNKIAEIQNKIERMKFLIKYNKIAHKFREHFIEISFKDKKYNQNITENLHYNLINLRNLWKSFSNKKDLQNRTIKCMQTRINMLRRKSEKEHKKYINTEDIIYEEIHETEHIQENIKKNEENSNIKNNIRIDPSIEKNERKEIKIGFKDFEKLFKVNMNINVNINVNKQYINNHFNNYDSNQFSKDKFKIRKYAVNNFNNNTNIK